MPDQTPSPESTTPAAATPPEPSAVLEEIIAKLSDNDEKKKKWATEVATQFSEQFQSGTTISPDSSVKMIQLKIAELDELLSKQLDEILHHPEFQQLEASWRGLHFLVKNTQTGTGLKLRLLSAAKKELSDDLEKAIDFDQSSLFKKIYEEEYGTFGGKPYSLLIGDYYIESGDVPFLRNMSGVAAAAHAPFISAASWKLFDLKDDFTQLGKPMDLAKLFESSLLTEWREFRKSEDSRYVTLVMPRMLIRRPYGEKDVKIDDFKLEETVSGTDHNKYLWANAAYALGERITNAFALYGWCAAIRGVEGGGKVEGLPVHNFMDEPGDEEKKLPALMAMKCPTEVTITDRREKELDSLGFVALCHCKGTNYAAFFGGQTTQQPRSYDTPAANSNALISARLPYLLAASRFAHFLKVICRDKIGSFQTKETLSLYLNRWISSYILGTDDAGQDLKAKFPLREARIDVFDVPGKPGAYRAVAFLRPHFQLEELTTSIRLVAELPPPAAA